MRRAPLLVLLAASAAFLLAASAFAQIGWYAKWNQTAPFVVKVTGLSDLPAAEQPLFLAAMADWSASPSVEYVAAGSGKVRVVVDTYCGSCATPNFSNGVLHGVTLHFDPAIFAWSDEQWVFCHELGHALGLGEGYPPSVGDPDSCMSGEETVTGSGTKLHPSQQDMDVLATMYPLGHGHR